MSIKWTVPAQKDILEAVGYVLKDDPLKAEQLARQILKTGEQVLLFPGSGPPSRIAGTRQIAVQKFPYVLVYRVTAKSIHVLRVLHTKRHAPVTHP